MARSIKKGPFIDGHLMEKINEVSSQKSKKVIKTWSRRSTIIPEAVGLTFAVHNGRKFVPPPRAPSTVTPVIGSRR